MRRAVLLAVVCLAAATAGAVPVLRSAGSGVSIDTTGTFRIQAQGLLLPSTEGFNGGFRIEASPGRDRVWLYPLFIRFRAGVLSLEAGAGTTVEDSRFTCLAAYVMPAFSLMAGSMGFMAGIPLAFRDGRFSAGIELMLTVN